MNASESIVVVSDVAASLGRRVRLRGRPGSILNRDVAAIKEMVAAELGVASGGLLALRFEGSASELSLDSQRLCDAGATVGSTLRAGTRSQAPQLVDVLVVNHEQRVEYRFAAVNCAGSCVGDVKHMVAQVAGIPRAEQQLRCEGRLQAPLDDGAALVGVVPANARRLPAAPASRVVLHLYRSPPGKNARADADGVAGAVTVSLASPIPESNAPRSHAIWAAPASTRALLSPTPMAADDDAAPPQPQPPSQVSPAARPLPRAYCRTTLHASPHHELSRSDSDSFATTALRLRLAEIEAQLLLESRRRVAHR